MKDEVLGLAMTHPLLFVIGMAATAVGACLALAPAIWEIMHRDAPRC